MKAIIRLMALAVVTFAFTQTSAERKPNFFGACYTLYGCQGASIGSFDDITCRSMGGHSIDNGGICFNL